jgi:hypothetical protein
VLLPHITRFLFETRIPWLLHASTAYGDINIQVVSV